MSRSATKRVKVTAKAAEVVTVRRGRQKPLRIWLLIADGKAAQIYDVEPVTFRLSPMPGSRFSLDKLPGRLIKVGNRSHHALDLHKSPHQMTEDVFVRSVADRMIVAAKKKAPDDVFIAAPPKAMAILRKALKGALGDKVSLQITHEWGHLAKEDVTGRLIEMLNGPKSRRQTRLA